MLGMAGAVPGRYRYERRTVLALSTVTLVTSIDEVEDIQQADVTRQQTKQLRQFQ